MKKSIKLIIAIVCTAILVTVIISIEKRNKSPKERFIETSVSSISSELTMSENSNEKRLIYDNYRCFQFDFLSYNIIDDVNIDKQDKYIGHYTGSKIGRYFGGNKECPDSAFLKGYTDYDAMQRDFPKYKEYLESYGERGMTEEEHTAFLNEHIEEYTEYRHPKTKYLFVTCRITKVDTPYLEYDPRSDIRVVASRGDSFEGDIDGICYFEIKNSTQEHDELEYFLPKVGDTIDCVIGFELRADDFDFTEENNYFVGFVPAMVENVEDYNLQNSKSMVDIQELPEN